MIFLGSFSTEKFFIHGQILYMYKTTLEGADNGLFYTLVSKLLYLLVLLLNFDWLVRLVECSNILTSNYDIQKYNFVHHHWGYSSICLLPLDPWVICPSYYFLLVYVFGLLGVFHSKFLLYTT